MARFFAVKGNKNAPKMTLANPIVLETLRFIFSVLKRKENLPYTMCLILLGLMAWYNIRQADIHAIDRYNWNMATVKMDSSARAERDRLTREIGALSKEILICNTKTEQLAKEIEALKKSAKK